MIIRLVAARLLSTKVFVPTPIATHSQEWGKPPLHGTRASRSQGETINNTAPAQGDFKRCFSSCRKTGRIYLINGSGYGTASQATEKVRKVSATVEERPFRAA